MIKVLKQIQQCLKDKMYAHAEMYLLEAIAELESQEPMSTLWQHGETGTFRVTTPDSITDCDAQWVKIGDLYTHSPQRTWVGLTDDEINEWTPEIHGVIQAIEAKLKEKNT